MKKHIKERTLKAAGYIATNKATIRDTAKKLKVAKSTVHRDLRVNLPRLNPVLYRNVDSILTKNLKERHIRGGMATKERYKQERERKIG